MSPLETARAEAKRRWEGVASLERELARLAQEEQRLVTEAQRAQRNIASAADINALIAIDSTMFDVVQRATRIREALDGARRRAVGADENVAREEQRAARPAFDAALAKAREGAKVFAPLMREAWRLAKASGANDGAKSDLLGEEFLHSCGVNLDWTPRQ